MTKKFYAVKKGKIPGIYRNWDQCKAQVHGFSGAVYKSFLTEEEAKSFIEGEDLSKKAKPASKKCDESKLNESLPGVIAYVDGSYNIKTKEFSYGMIVLMPDGNEFKYAEKYNDTEMASMRNVAGEIKGAQAAMEFAVTKGIDHITIFHDYEGIARWCLGEWKANKKGTKAYKEYYDKVKDKLKVKFVKVKGHSNDKYNDIADQLAKQALAISGIKYELNEIDFH